MAVSWRGRCGPLYAFGRPGAAVVWNPGRASHITRSTKRSRRIPRNSNSVVIGPPGGSGWRSAAQRARYWRAGGLVDPAASGDPA